MLYILWFMIGYVCLVVWFFAFGVVSWFVYCSGRWVCYLLIVMMLGIVV